MIEKRKTTTRSSKEVDELKNYFLGVLWVLVGLAACVVLVLLYERGREDRAQSTEEIMYSQLKEFILKRSGRPADVTLPDLSEVHWIEILKDNREQDVSSWLRERGSIWRLEELHEEGLLESVPEFATEGVLFCFWLDEPNWLSGQVWRNDVAAVVYFEGDNVGASWIAKPR